MGKSLPSRLREWEGGGQLCGGPGGRRGGRGAVCGRGVVGPSYPTAGCWEPFLGLNSPEMAFKIIV